MAFAKELRVISVRQFSGCLDVFGLRQPETLLLFCFLFTGQRMMQEIATNELKGKRGLQRIINAAGYSKDGLIAAYRHEAAFRQLVWLHAVLLPLAFCFDFDTPVRMLLVGASLLSLIVELFNTAIEAVVDRISEELHPLSKIAKDAGSAAQLVALLLVGVFWLMALNSL